MKYTCKKFAPGLTVGAMYAENFLNACVFNAWVKNDKGVVTSYPRKEFFDIFEEVEALGVIYISGPMTGYDNFNRAAFKDKAIELSWLGYNVLNPATLPDGLTQAQYMSICQPMVLCSGFIYMLKGYEDSKGAIAELALANKLGLKVIYETH